LDWDDLNDNEFVKRIETGPLQLEIVKSKDEIPTFTKRTVEPLEDVLDNDEKSILAVHD
jgi:hypothetical protein